MPSDERVLAWIEPRGGDCLASFVAESSANRRAPAMRLCATPGEAQQWVTNEADAIGAAIKWIVEAPASCGCSALAEHAIGARADTFVDSRTR